ncbi:hypothetical protein [Bacillus sinesaloumensis]|uniref:hypothetical protein n=1 Tax=Litchfieldia sinesaloumensis TaxID=1926280 RepID=UPI00098857BC|nr:hypothetical protein [Bacillus sinesaloumensis]
MYEIIKTYKQAIPDMNFVGMKYGDMDRINGGFGAKWEEWFEKERFTKLESLLTDDFMREYKDYNTNIGLMRWKEGEPFEYWIGMFLPKGTVAPKGYKSINISASNLGVCWVQGTEPDVYGKEKECADNLLYEGYELVHDDAGAWWFFERYGCPRFTEPDEKGKVILDICHFVK